jgi:ATP phosphoribosyltransferase
MSRPSSRSAAQLGVAGNDVLLEFDYPEIYAPVDLGIGKCRLAVAEPVEMVGEDDPTAGPHPRRDQVSQHHRAHFAARGVRAECIKLSGAMELAPTLGPADASSTWSRPGHSQANRTRSRSSTSRT